jgi:diguanylate cyclase (GGDEF)-like protein/putative nucleotidyltransferase with HDIG domain
MTTLLPSPGVHPFDWVDDIVYILDAQLRFTFVNAFALNSWQKRHDELLGLTFEDALPQKATPEVMDAFRQALQTGERTEFDTFGLRHQGWINVTAYPHQGSLIVQIKRLPRHTGTAVPTDHDALTGCLTRSAFQNRLKTIPLPQILAIVDLNLLKSVNTLRGHSGGDAHIRTVAHALQDAVPVEALVGRWGGDEFVILAPGDDLHTLQERLDATNTVLPCPEPDTVAFTVGLAVWQPGSAYDRAFALADEQLQLRKEKVQQAAPGAREAASFVAFSQELEALTDPGALIQHALNRLLSLLDFDQAAYAVIEEGETFYSHHAYREGVSAPEPALNVRVPLVEPGMLHTVQHTRTSVWSTDYQTTAYSLPLVVEQGVKSGIVTPVLSQGQVVAAIVLRTIHRWQSITPHMRRVVELTALRLEHALELRRAVGEVRSTLDAGLLTLGVVLEARDSETQGHTVRAASMAARLGAHLGLNSTELGYLRQGAYLHDLGKLSIPNEILRKPGPLTPEEWTVMQSHTIHGHHLAASIPGLPPTVLDVIRSHHERWDGRGYPDGLAGTDIPWNARIFAVCDVYDALISNRPYKAAWTHEAALHEISAQAGRHFDPQVCQVFVRLFAKDPVPPSFTA